MNKEEAERLLSQLPLFDYFTNVKYTEYNQIF